MRSVGARWLAVLASAAMLLFAGVVFAETKTMSWDQVTLYTDNTTISGTALPVSYDAFWATSSSFTTPHMLLTNQTALSVTFDIVAQGMVRGSVIYFSARARTALGEVSDNSPAVPWTVPNLGLVSLAITAGPSSVNESSTATYTAKATWSDGSTTDVNASWSVAPNLYCSINGGVLTTLAVTSNQAVTITASFTSDGVTQTATKDVTIVNSNRPAAPRGLGIH